MRLINKHDIVKRMRVAGKLDAFKRARNKHEYSDVWDTAGDFVDADDADLVGLVEAVSEDPAKVLETPPVEVIEYGPSVVVLGPDQKENLVEAVGLAEVMFSKSLEDVIASNREFKDTVIKVRDLILEAGLSKGSHAHTLAAHVRRTGATFLGLGAYAVTDGLDEERVRSRVITGEDLRARERAIQEVNRERMAQGAPTVRLAVTSLRMRTESAWREYQRAVHALKEAIGE